MKNILILSPWNLHQVCSAINIVTQDNADNKNKLVDGLAGKTIYVMLSSMDWSVMNKLHFPLCF